MNWRPWIVVGSVFFISIVDIALLATEVTREAVQSNSPKLNNTDPLGTLQYTASSRLSNLQKMGLPDDMADAANQEATSIVHNRKDILQKMMKDQSDVASRAFCVGGSVPPRYAAAQVLIIDNGTSRSAVQPDQLTALEAQPWYELNTTREIYKTLELDSQPKRQPDATLMGVAALMTGQADAAIQGDTPWGHGGLTAMWSFDTVLKTYQNNGIRANLIDYFAEMSAMLEIANGDKGICVPA